MQAKRAWASARKQKLITSLSMAIFAPVLRSLESVDVPFILIGGHAVALLGHYRNTFDLDLLISESHLEMAHQTLSSLGYRKYFETSAFLQLSAPSGFPPLDLMIVDQITFERLNEFTEERMFDGERILIPDAVHLVALKLHAGQSASRRRTEIDWEDIIGVLRAADQNIDDAEFRAIVVRYGGAEAIEEIKRRLTSS
jgi:hypothetical protein